jgi:integrase
MQCDAKRATYFTRREADFELKSKRYAPHNATMSVKRRNSAPNRPELFPLKEQRYDQAHQATPGSSSSLRRSFQFVPDFVAKTHRQLLALHRLSFLRSSHLASLLVRFDAATAPLSRDRENRKRFVSLWTAAIGEIPVALLTMEIVQNCLGSWTDVSPATRNRRLAFLRRALTWAVENGEIERSPLESMKFEPEPLTRERVLSPDEESRLCAALGRSAPTAKLLIYTGLRAGEAFDLRWSDVTERAVFVRRSKSGRSRSVPLCAEAAQALTALPRAGAGVLTQGSPRWARANWGRRVLRPAADGIGLHDVSMHTFRHTFASRLVATGVPIAAVQVLLGHRHISTTMRYTHFDEGFLHSQVSKLDSR